MSLKKKFSNIILTGSTALLLSSAASNVFAVDLYAESGYKGRVINSYGECWQTIGGRSELCGAPAGPMDSDGDGVTDDKDKCPNTPRGAPVDSDGCPLDSDGDGVYDYMDKCPGTPAGAKVDSDGCMEELTLNNVTFELNKAELTSKAKSILAPIADVLKGRPDIKTMTVTGHTDSTGSEDYNQSLSEKRATAVADYFKNAGVSISISSSGEGESNPVADNKTAAGRAQNRRVELSVGK